MAKTLICLLMLMALAAACPAARAQDAPPDLPNKWVFCYGYRRNSDDVEQIKSIVRTAAEHGLNGMVLSSFAFDSVTRWTDQDYAFLAEVADACREAGIELIPTAFSAGYGGGALGYDRNFAAALPATIRLQARGNRAVPVDRPNLLENGNLERHRGDRFNGYDSQDQPGEVSFADTLVAVSGTASIRFENFAANRGGHARIMQTVAVRPGRHRFSFKIKTEDFAPVSGLRALVIAGNRTVASARLDAQPTQDWTDVGLDFVARGEGLVSVYAGVWGGESGRVWVDDMGVYEYGALSEIVRREGTPLELRSADRDVAFVEGRDFEPVENRRGLEFLTLTPNTSVREGENLELSCYRISFIGRPGGRQISLCMSNPALYEYWEAQARRLHEVLPYKRFLLSMDEIRNGGGCELCKGSRMTMGQILGDCFTRQREIFRKIDPEIEVLTWSDMLDPNQNARNNYYRVVGTFGGSWRYVPEDLVIMCWWNERKAESLAFFSAHGFRTMGACYYDARDLKSSREWLDLLRQTPDAQGIMYTSWRRKYDLLADFGDMVSGALTHGPAPLP